MTETSQLRNVKIELSVSHQALSDLLCNAIEGGSNYWCQAITRLGKPQTQTNTPIYLYRHEYPFHEGCALLVIPSEETPQKECIVDLATITKAIQIMADKHKDHFLNFLNDNADAETGDVFLQLCCFGEVLFG